MIPYYGDKAGGYELTFKGDRFSTNIGSYSITIEKSSYICAVVSAKWMKLNVQYLLIILALLIIRIQRLLLV